MCIFLLMFSTVIIFIIILFRKTSIRYGTKHEYENIQMDVSSTQIDKTFYMIALIINKYQHGYAEHHN